ncbi:hypothetical protein GLOTRDRAFT_49043 [Gloeophyllum trabeum ATCC 11539]|uniref:DUF6533 domain-containing protein n=1 Tax=Gloeophyllum trabeum (strain ATCC 11539 / FP-39264 / Madison 617) TaxID=670483 RepID=S7RAM0_GLOTA|nr:uncharacterized protein GLOTRDRAFT_49043 [Gloeophyllum trabeum ATCC 11539]EPQ51305.1 hypothetical protein GLOTRDRAFT_49043 [Gloeophyllum trabeum ATCC 11539]
MSAPNTTFVLPPGVINPETPLAYLPSVLATQFEASRYLYIASLSAWIWDFLLSLKEDYTLLSRYRLNIPTMVYFVSRIASLAYVTTSTVFQVSPIGSCQALQYALGWCYVVAGPSTSLLFLFRIRAVFFHNKPVVLLFSLLWLAVLGTAFTVPFAITGEHIGPTQRCINTAVKSFSSSSIIVGGIFDSLVFLTISYRLLTTNLVEETWSSRLNSFLSGSGFTRLPAALLQGGQMYYLATSGVNIFTIIMVLTPSVPAVYHAMFTVPNLALENAMAGRVFRQLKLGMLHGGEETLIRGDSWQQRYGQASRGGKVNATIDMESSSGTHALHTLTSSARGIQVKVDEVISTDVSSAKQAPLNSDSI